MNNQIHAIWLGPQMTPLSFACIDDWTKQGYSVKLWTEQDQEIHQWINQCEFAKQCYKRKLYAFVTDYLRLKILREYGGLYLDTDVTIQKNPFHLFANVAFSVGFEDKSTIGTAIIYSRKGSKIINKLIDFYEHDIILSNQFMGPQIMTNAVINENGYLLEPNQLYPVDYFYSYQGEALNFDKPENAFLVHWFQHSWKDNKKLTFLKSKHRGLAGKLYVWQKYFFRF